MARELSFRITADNSDAQAKLAQTDAALGKVAQTAETKVGPAFNLLEGQTKSLAGTAEQLAGKVTGFGEKAKAAFENPLGAIRTLTSSGEGLGEALAGVAGVAAGVLAIGLGIAAAAAIYGASKLYEWTLHAAAAGEKASDLAARLQAPVGPANQLASAVEVTGGSLDSLSAAAFQLQTRLADTGPQGEKARAALRSLGLDADAFANARHDQQILQLSDAFRKIPEGASAAKIGVDLMGEGFRSVLPTLMRPLSELTDVSDRLGFKWTHDTAGAAKEFEERSRILDKTIEGLKDRIGVALLPALDRVLTWLEKSKGPLENLVLGVNLATTAVMGMAKQMLLVAGSALIVNGFRDLGLSLITLAAAFDTTHPKAAQFGQDIDLPAKKAPPATQAMLDYAAAVQRGADVLTGKALAKEIQFLTDKVIAAGGAAHITAKEGADLSKQLIQLVRDGGQLRPELEHVIELFGGWQSGNVKVVEGLGSIERQLPNATSAWREDTAAIKENIRQQQAWSGVGLGNLLKLTENLAPAMKRQWEEWRKEWTDGTEAAKRIYEQFVNHVVDQGVRLFDGLVHGWDSFRSAAKSVLEDILGYFERRFIATLVQKFIGGQQQMASGMAGMAAVGGNAMSGGNAPGAPGGGGGGLASFATTHPYLSAGVFGGITAGIAAYQGGTGAGLTSAAMTAGLTTGSALATGATIGGAAALGATTFGVGAAVVAGVMLYKHLTEGKKANDLRDTLTAQSGGRDQMEALIASLTSGPIAAALETNLGGQIGEAYHAFVTGGNKKDVQAAFDRLQQLLQLQQQSVQAAQQTLEKYGLTLDDLKSPAERAGASISTLASDYQRLKAMGFGDAQLAKAMAGGLNDIIKAALETGQKLPPALQPVLETLIRSGGLTDEVKRKLLGLADPAPWQAMEEAAGRYGIAVDKLGAAFQQAKSDDAAKQFAADFKLLIDNGADVAAVVEGMSGKVNEYFQNVQRYGLSVPENMKPVLQAMVDAGKLTDLNGDKIKDLSDVKFAPTLEDSVKKLVDKLDELIDRIGNRLPDVVKNTHPTVHVGVEYDDPGFTPGAPNPAPGNASGPNPASSRLFNPAAFTPAANPSRSAVYVTQNIDARGALIPSRQGLRDLADMILPGVTDAAVTYVTR